MLQGQWQTYRSELRNQKADLHREGTVDEVQYEFSPRAGSEGTPGASLGSGALNVSRVGTLTADTVTYLAPSTIHSSVNDRVLNRHYCFP